MTKAAVVTDLLGDPTLSESVRMRCQARTWSSIMLNCRLHIDALDLVENA